MSAMNVSSCRRSLSSCSSILRWILPERISLAFFISTRPLSCTMAIKLRNSDSLSISVDFALQILLNLSNS